jgi:hypothetical protein
MHKVKAQDFGLRCASNYLVPKPYNQGLVTGYLDQVFKEFGGYGIGTQNLTFAEGDRLFGYSVALSLFNNNANFVLNGEGLISTISNGRTKGDAELILDLLTKALACAPEKEKITHSLTFFCHCDFEAPSSMVALMGDILKLKIEALPVAFGLLSNDPMDAILPPNERLRLDIAPSELRKDAVFMSWRFSIKGPINKDFAEGVSKRAKTLASQIGLEMV